MGIRYKQHLFKSQMEKHTHKASWIKGLANHGLFPEIVTLEQVDEDKWEEREMWWIVNLKSRGCRLTNHTIGGEGIKRGSKLRPETIAKIKQGLTGRKVSPETREKIRQGRLGKKHSEATLKLQSEKQRKRWEALSEEQKSKMEARLTHDAWSADRKRKFTEVMFGRKVRSNTHSKHVGVSWNKIKRRWIAYFTRESKFVQLGYFKTEEAAKKAREAALV